MYQSYWGLQQTPFPVEFDARYFFHSAPVIETLARFEFVVESKYRVAVMSGPKGVGKSMTLRTMVDRYTSPAFQFVLLSLFGVEHQEFLIELLTQLGESRVETRTTPWLWRRLQDRIKLNSFQRVHTIILLDDASDAEVDVLNAVIRIAQGNTTSPSLVSIVLATDCDRQALLGDRLLELSQLRLELAPWDEADTEEYLRTAMMAAGGDGAVFDRETTRTIHQLAAGNPRRIRQLAELSLVAAAGAELPRIDDTIVSAVHQDLVAATATA